MAIYRKSAVANEANLGLVNGDIFRQFQTANQMQNFLINGSFDFWQRGTSDSASATNRYLSDRWKQEGNTSTAVISRQTATTGTFTGESQYFYRAIIATGGGAANYQVLTQYLEDVRTLAGKTVTLSFWAKADAAKNLSLNVDQVFGTGGSTGVSVYSGSKFAITNTWAKYSITFNVSSISSKTVGTNSSLSVYLWMDAGSTYDARTDSLGNQSGTFDFGEMMLNIGSEPAPFARAGGTIGGEELLCKRYFELLISGAIHIYQSIGTVIATTIDNGRLAPQAYKVEKRVSPTINITGNYAFTIGAVVSSVSVQGESTNQKTWGLSVIYTGGVQNYAYLLRINNDSTARITADAEL